VTRLQAAYAKHTSDATSVIAVGIDVGGPRKGFHAVALSGGVYFAQLASCEAQQVTDWCRSVVHASVIAIDAPCRWSTHGRARPCERELMQKGIWCFSSPSHQKAHTPHRTGYYDWMLRGEELYQALEATHPLLSALPLTGNACFETFPHAVTWHLRGGNANARAKQSQRRALLAQAGLDPTPFTNIDLVDAALCALTAHHLASGRPCTGYGDPSTGLIVVPAEVPGRLG
jgi:predicted nuclease with RNAse H fold